MIRDSLSQCRRHFVAAAAFSALVNLLNIAPTLYMLQVYDRVIPTRGVQTLFFLTSVLLFSLATLTLLDRARTRILTRAGVRIDLTLAPLVLDAALERPGLPGARTALRDLDRLRSTLTGPTIIALFDAPWVPLYIFVCFLVHPWIGFVAIAGCVVVPVIAWINEHATRARLDEAQTAANLSYSSQDAVLSSADAVRALGMRRALARRQMRQRAEMLAAQTEASLATGGYMAVTKFVRLALQSIALGLGALLSVDNLISGGAVFASSFLIARALQPIEQLIGTWRGIVQARQSYRSLDHLLASAPAPAQRTQMPAPRGDLKLESVTLFNTARDSAVLQSLSFDVSAGEVIAIVGPSGAGKSTLVRLIAGAVLADRGTVRLDGADIRDWDAEILARHIGYLPQDPSLFAGTIAENIARFDAELSDDRSKIDARIIAAARKVSADTLIRRLPGAYDHMLTLGGRGLSAGQAQRIALARAVYGDPALLILDEPNAHLDAEGDAALVAAISALKQERRTVLIVSHKLSILPVVDKLLILQDGRVQIFGPRDEVLPKIVRPAGRSVSAPAEPSS